MTDDDTRPSVQTSGRLLPARGLALPHGLWTRSRGLLLAGIVGVGAGVAAIGFYALSHAVFELAMGGIAGYHPVQPRGTTRDYAAVFDYSAATIRAWACLLVPAAGGLIVGILVQRFAPEAKGHGTDAAVDAFHRRQGVIRPAVIWVKTIASAITLGSGGSGGREGPIAQIGAGFGSWIATRLRVSNRERRILLAVGMGAGVAAIFRAPLAGALFAAEILYRNMDFESDVIIPSLLGCIVAYSVFTIPFGQGSLFAAAEIPNAHLFVFRSPIELLFYVALGGVLAAVGYFYVRCFYGTEALFDRLRIRPWLKPAVGGLATGALALLLFHLTDDGRVLGVLAFGYTAIQEAFDLPNAAVMGPDGWRLAAIFLLVALGKAVTTSLTIGSGGSGGVFGPSMVIGGSAGAAFGIVASRLWPSVAPHPGCFALVGMAGLFGGVARVPISTLLMVSEMTGDYELTVPVMAIVLVTFVSCRKFSLYRSQVASLKDSPAHRGDFLYDVLEGIRVGDLRGLLRPPSTVSAGARLGALIPTLLESRSHYFPVVEGDARLVGIFTLNDVRRHLNDRDLLEVLVVADIMTTPVIAVTVADDLNQVMRRFTQKNLDEIPVVEAGDSPRLLGMLRRREVIEAYNARISSEREEAARAGA
jgi:CIC family chloride channel protein